MLTQIQIQNVAIVDQLELDLSKGMTVVTGETGAGKSILLDALNLALGERADSDLIRQGCDRAEISLSFNIVGQTNLHEWLKENDLDWDDSNDCLIRRTITADGRSKGYINGHLVPMQSLRNFGELLVDIHGQHAHQSLLKRELQRQALDDYAGHHALLEQVNICFKHWKQLQDQQRALEKSRRDRDERVELLSYQTQELEALGLTEDEIRDIESEHDRLAHLNQLQEGISDLIYRMSDDDENAINRHLRKSLSSLEELQRYDAGLAAHVSLLNDIVIQAQELGDELRHYLDGLDVDPARLDWVNDRLGLLHDLSRKHRIETSALPSLLESLSSELESLRVQQGLSENLQAEIQVAENTYQAAATQLSVSRQKAAQQLAKLVSENLHLLGMKQARFEVDFSPIAEPSSGGNERAEFMVTMNPGQPLKPLSKVASGGELSRISLALQVIIARTGRIPTLIFDEVDVGIGGGIAEIVGRLLLALSKDRQILCVTHQPQVAALGNHHLHVSKSHHKKTTQTCINALTAEQRRDEIARMLGGLEITEQTRSHAAEMIERAQLITEPVL